MSESTPRSPRDDTESVYNDYILDVRILEVMPPDAETPQYRFEAPQHTPMTFDDPETATLYADVYFDTNGFQEAGTGDRGVPPEVIQAGRDTLAAYFLTMPGTDVNWVASFYGKTPPKIERYIASVRQRAQEIRANAAEQGLE
ncbi:hypothetical protein [Natrinema limicola]|uniref:Uncharacterized protein n=1 Tax=Natrinema limicola JCM 13563 TaxID=1230457 RepID=M0CRE0_9EURY|nr:hypothetical protein [Natrinema limicola]ELZ25208.1 hypothetical protein C476_02172 [Natrinema limicola JCM 13563]